ncbi:MAG: metal ABC transporter substrate-binding protein [Treponema socranskii subsp. buccale]
MKKNIIKIASALIFAALVAGGAVAAPAKKNASDGTVKIVTDIFPVYDWIREITKNSAAKIDLTLLLDNGVDLHSYQPAVADVAKIAECNFFVYVGGESEGWMDDACKEIKNKNSVVLKLLDSLGDAAKEEEVVEGMEADHDHESADEHDHGHEPKAPANTIMNTVKMKRGRNTTSTFGCP